MGTRWGRQFTLNRVMKIDNDPVVQGRNCAAWPSPDSIGGPPNMRMPPPRPANATSGPTLCDHKSTARPLVWEFRTRTECVRSMKADPEAPKAADMHLRLTEDVMTENQNMSTRDQFAIRIRMPLTMQRPRHPSQVTSFALASENEAYDRHIHLLLRNSPCLAP
jgi:hypothetical protein